MVSVMEYLESALNAEQLEAATTTDGPLLVLAGAGVGKTRCIVHRIAYLVHTGRARPHEIFAVTFTNKAAGEMRDRLVRLIGPGASDMWIGTFHALAARMLRIEGHRIGIGERFTIYDEEDALRLVKRTMEELAAEVGRWTVTPGEIVEAIDRAKNRGLDAPAYLAETEGEVDATVRAVRVVYPAYQRALRAANALDFGDLLLRAVELLSTPEGRDRFAGPDGFKYVLVDEGQDTNPAQHRIVDLLAAEHRNVCVVGDDQQAIYSFRGADPSYLLAFPERWGARVVALETNYRSTANIIEAANAVIAKNRTRFPKALRTTTPAGAPVIADTVERGEDEAELVARAIRDRLERGVRPQDIAILYRQNAQSGPFERALRYAEVPHVVLGGTSFYAQREVQDLLAYLRLAANPESASDLRRIANVPRRHVTTGMLDRMEAAGQGWSVAGAGAILPGVLTDEQLAEEGLAPHEIRKLRALGHLLADLHEIARVEPASVVLDAVLARTCYREDLRRQDPARAEERIALVDELVAAVAEHERRETEGATEPTEVVLDVVAGNARPDRRTSLARFLDTAALASTTDKTAAGAVALATLHSAKGLEWPVVFLVGMEEETFPTARAIAAGVEAIEEERRLCYVGMTRAMSELIMLGARRRRLYGEEQARSSSRFLAELPPTVTRREPAEEYEPRFDEDDVADDAFAAWPA